MAGRNPVRSCVSCRKRGGKGDLVKLANTPAGVVIDYGEKLPGRGAYVCLEKACIDKCLREGALSRAFRQSVRAPEPAEFYAELAEKVRRKVESLLGMSRKSGQAALGFDAALEAARKSAGGLLVMAGDAAGNTERKFMGSVREGRFDTFRFSTKEGLGRLLGASPVAVVFIPGSALSEALEREMGRLIQMGRG